ncbi:MAG: acyltransferase 3, partial [Burkholderiaceae bacterium]|nr:acyltransferase 3 [Burkholderiaceae bacterium]
ILILMPVWLLGVLVYYIIKHRQVSEWAGWLMFTGSLLLYTLFRCADYPDYLYGLTASYIDQDFMMYTLKWSQEFLSSYAIGLLVAIHFIGAATVAPRLASLLYAGEKPIRYLAGFTFATYLFHYPLLQFFAAIASHFNDQMVRNMIMIFGSIAVIWALGTVTERRKADIKRWILFWCELFSRKVWVRL